MIICIMTWEYSQSVILIKGANYYDFKYSFTLSLALETFKACNKEYSRHSIWNRPPRIFGLQNSAQD